MNAVLVLSGSSVLYLERQKENSLVTVLEVDDIPLLHSASFKLRYYVTPERSSTFGTDSRFPPSPPPFSPFLRVPAPPRFRSRSVVWLNY